MKKTSAYITFAYKLLVITFVAVILFSCNFNSSENLKSIHKSVAYFDYFSYIGSDDFYTENPLPGNDYFYNPILPGWYSDPSICSNGKGDFFLVTSTFSYFPGVPVFHSTDLVNWKQIGHILDRESQLSLVNQRTSGGIFAPAISYNPLNQTYYMITTNVGAGNFFVKTQDPFGSWSDPIWLPEVKGIDPSIFFDDNGKAYIVNNDAPEGTPLYDGHRAIWVQEFDVAADKTFGPRKVLVNGGVKLDDKPIWIEGPHMYKINGQYFLMCAEGGTGPEHSEVILKGNHPMGEFKAWEKNPILTQRHLDANRENPITCAGHADMVQTKEGNWWAVFLATRPINGEFENLGRETFMMPVKWSNDGFPYMTQNNDLIPMILQKPGTERKPGVTFGNFTHTDNFDSDKLGLEWITLRAPATSLYSLTEIPGYFSLKYAETNASELQTPAYIARRIQHHKFECTTKMYFNPNSEKEAAGILLYKDEYHQYFLAVGQSSENKKINLIKIKRDGNESLASHEIRKDKPVQLKVVSEGTTYSFHYSEGRKKWKTLISGVDARFLSTDVAGGFTGTTIGMYATKKL